MTPCTPQLDVVMYAHLIRCHFWARGCSPSVTIVHLAHIVWLEGRHLPFVVTTRPSTSRFAIELVHDLVPHLLLATSSVIFTSLPAQWAIHFVELLDVVIPRTQQSQFDVEITRDVERLGSCATSVPQEFGGVLDNCLVHSQVFATVSRLHGHCKH